MLDFEVGAGRDALKQYVLKRYNLSELCTGCDARGSVGAALCGRLRFLRRGVLPLSDDL